MYFYISIYNIQSLPPVVEISGSVPACKIIFLAILFNFSNIPDLLSKIFLLILSKAYNFNINIYKLWVSVCSIYLCRVI